MKKLFLLLVLTVSYSSISFAEERIDLVCTLDTIFEWDTGERITLLPEDRSLVIFPESKEFVYESLSGNYLTKGNKIIFISEKAIPQALIDSGILLAARNIYTLDTLTSVFEDDMYTSSDESDGEYVKGITHSGECKKIEKLF
jgi:hypothetical protein